MARKKNPTNVFDSGFIQRNLQARNILTSDFGVSRDVSGAITGGAAGGAASVSQPVQTSAPGVLDAILNPLGTLRRGAQAVGEGIVDRIRNTDITLGPVRINEGKISGMDKLLQKEADKDKVMFGLSQDPNSPIDEEDFLAINKKGVSDVKKQIESDQPQAPNQATTNQSSNQIAQSFGIDTNKFAAPAPPHDPSEAFGFGNAANLQEPLAQGGGFSESFAKLITDPQFQLLMGNLGSALGSPLGAAVSDSARSRIAEEITRGQQEGLEGFRDKSLDIRERELGSARLDREQRQATSDRRFTKTEKRAEAAAVRDEERLKLSQEAAVRKTEDALSNFYLAAIRGAHTEAAAKTDSMAFGPEKAVAYNEALQQILLIKYPPEIVKAILTSNESATAATVEGKRNWQQDLK